MEQLDIFSFVSGPELPPDHARVYEQIRDHRGRRAGVLQATLAERTGFSSRAVRQIVKRLLRS